MQSRMTNPAVMIPATMKALQDLHASIAPIGLPAALAELVHLRVSQINGCSVCVDMHSRSLRRQGESDQRIFTVAAWREAPYFSDAERAALALAEELTRISDRPDAVSDEVWDEVNRHYDQQGVAALLVTIAAINVWNRLNVATRQVAGAWTAGTSA